MKRPLYIAKPLLPKINDLNFMLNEIWKSEIVTNGGPLHNKLELQLGEYLKVPTSMLFNNGTIALLVALKMFDFPIGSEIITTPLTFAATAHAIEWNSFKPVFADIDAKTLTLEPESVERAITKNTVAILAVHVYGTICDLNGLQNIANGYGLKLIYDAAHAFGATVNGNPIGCYGDASVFSFHATKLFNTIEGGMITTPNKNDHEKIYYLRNFGIKNEEEVISVGINGKMNEIQAAIGLLNLPLVEEERNLRKILRRQYCERLENIPGITLPLEQKNVINSEQYFPIIIEPKIFGRSRDDVYESLKKINIFSRKYFHPICTDFKHYKNYPIISSKVHPSVNGLKNKILCLPFHSGVDEEDINKIVNSFLV